MQPGFYLFVIGIHHHTNGLVDIGWLLGGIALFTLGEIFISPVGLSMVTRLAPARFTSLLMGSFFFAIGLASYLAQAFVRFIGIPENSLSGNMTTSLMSTLGGYETIFTFIALFALVSGFCALIVTPFVYGVFKRHA